MNLKFNLVSDFPYGINKLISLVFILIPNDINNATLITYLEYLYIA
jgi:hypothetical protein